MTHNFVIGIIQRLYRDFQFNISSICILNFIFHILACRFTPGFQMRLP